MNTLCHPMQKLSSLWSPKVSSVKADSRYMLGVEALVGLQTITWAVIGGLIPVGFGLYKLLEKHGMRDDWIMLLLPYGIIQFIVAVYVWVQGRHWPKEKVYKAVYIRMLVAAAGSVLWASAAATLVAETGRRGYTFSFMAATCILANAVSYYANSRIRVVLDARFKTHKLASTITNDK